MSRQELLAEAYIKFQAAAKRQRLKREADQAKEKALRRQTARRRGRPAGPGRGANLAYAKLAEEMRARGLVSTTEAATMIGVTQRVIAQRMKNGSLPSTKIGQYNWIRLEDVANAAPARGRQAKEGYISWTAFSKALGVTGGSVTSIIKRYAVKVEVDEADGRQWIPCSEVERVMEARKAKV